MQGAAIEQDVIFNVEGGAGVITLNRPQALNALNFAIIREMTRQLEAWAKDPAIRAVIVTGMGEKSFCAGGDIKQAAMAVKQGGAARVEAADFFRAEYTLNYRIKTYPKPYVAFAHGIVMGGGVGISAHGSHRIVTETTLFAMPEATIGFFPDVGASHFLSRCPGRIGAYLALTGRRLRTADAIYIGFGTHHVPQAALPQLRAAIAQAPDNVNELLNDFAAAPPQDGELPQLREKIDACFSYDRAEDIVAALEKDGSPWALETLKTLQGVSPSSVKIALHEVKLGAGMNFAEAMTMEYRLSQAVLDRPDFCEGVRAALIDKDRQPKWRPARLEEVTEAEVKSCFEPLGSRELVL